MNARHVLANFSAMPTSRGDKINALLSSREDKVNALNAIGLSHKEGADLLNVSQATYSKHIDNLKKKVGKGKATELAAIFICSFYGDDFEEFKEKVLSKVLSVVLCVFTTTLCALMILLSCPLQLSNIPARNRRAQRTASVRVIRLTRREVGDRYEMIPKIA